MYLSIRTQHSFQDSFYKYANLQFFPVQIHKWHPVTKKYEITNRTFQKKQNAFTSIYYIIFLFFQKLRNTITQYAISSRPCFGWLKNIISSITRTSNFILTFKLLARMYRAHCGRSPEPSRFTGPIYKGYPHENQMTNVESFIGVQFITK